MAFYFAYGSNLLLRRLRERVPSARAVGPARLAGFAWRCDKRGRDGTGKANLVAAPSAETWGVLFTLESGDWPALDRAEGGYARIAVEVRDLAGTALRADTYLSRRTDPRLRPADWYLALILEGARENALPSDWIAELLGRAGG